jgi:hypothetical protein
LIQVSDATVRINISRKDVRTLIMQLDREIKTRNNKDTTAAGDTYLGDSRMSAYSDFSSYLAALNRVYNYQKLTPNPTHPTLVTNMKKASQVLQNYGFDVETIV